MDKISEIQINNLTRRHIARLLTKLEQEFDTPFWIKQEIKKEFWLFNQNLKQKMVNNNIIVLDDEEHIYNPE